MSESELKLAVEQYLQYQKNLGKLWFTRLNSGEAFIKKAGKVYKIQLCPAGTADLFVLKDRRCIFVELKAEAEKPSPEQEEFGRAVEDQGASYYVIREFDPNDQDDLLMRALWR